MTEANIVSWTDMYNIYEQDPDAYASIIPKGTKLCPIYMWFEESGKKEIRNISGDLNLTEVLNNCKEVKTGTVYWWCESDKKLTNINALANWDTSNVTNMSYAITGYNMLENINALKYWNTSKVTNMKAMFGADYDIGGGIGITNLSALSNWDVSKVTDMSYMFMNCNNITDASAINDWNIQNVNDFTKMFGDGDSGTSIHPEFTKVLGTWSGGTFIPN